MNHKQQSLTAAQRLRLSQCALGIMLYAFTQQALGLLVQLLPGSTVMAQLWRQAAASALPLAMALAMLLLWTPLNRQALGWKPLKPRRLFFFLPLYLGLSVLLNLAAVLLQPYDANVQEPLPTGFGPVCMVLLIYCVIPAVGEELLFRGGLQGLLQPCGSAIAIAAPAVLFGLLHGRASQIFVALCTGLFFGWVAQATNGITTGVVLHLVNNLAAAVQIYLSQMGDAGLAAGVQTFYCGACLLWAAGALIIGFLYGKHPRFHPAKPGPGFLRALEAPLYAFVVLFYLGLRLAQSLGVSL